MSVKLKKRANAHLIIENCGIDEYFEISPGFRINSIWVEALGTLSGNIAIGETDGVNEGAVFTVTGAPTADGDITVAGVTVAILDGDTVEEVAAKIAAATYTGFVVTADGDEVTFLATAEGNVSNVTVSAGTTGATFSAVTTSAGTLPAEVVDSTAVTTGAGNITKLTIKAGKDYVATTATAPKKFYVNMTDASLVGKVNLYIDVERFN